MEAPVRGFCIQLSVRQETIKTKELAVPRNEEDTGAVRVPYPYPYPLPTTDGTAIPDTRIRKFRPMPFNSAAAMFSEFFRELKTKNGAEFVQNACMDHLHGTCMNASAVFTAR